MLFSTLLTALTAASVVSAIPHPAPSPRSLLNFPGFPSLPSLPGLPGFPGCLTDDSATAYVNAFIKTLQISGNETAAFTTALSAVANPGVQEISDSSNFLGGYPLGSVTLPNFAAFQAFHATSPPGGVYQVTTLNIWHTCNVITWRWRFVLYPGAQPIQGINVFVLNNNGKADIVYDEFNSATWAQDLGYTITPPSGPPGGK